MRSLSPVEMREVRYNVLLVGFTWITTSINHFSVTARITGTQVKLATKLGPNRFSQHQWCKQSARHCRRMQTLMWWRHARVVGQSSWRWMMARATICSAHFAMPNFAGSVSSKSMSSIIWGFPLLVDHSEIHSFQSNWMHLLGKEAVDAEEETSLANWHPDWRSTGNCSDCWPCRTRNHLWRAYFCWKVCI